MITSNKTSVNCGTGEQLSGLQIKIKNTEIS